jgi:pimeloyl-ACP methyl ester carboxylesterase
VSSPDTGGSRTVALNVLVHYVDFGGTTDGTTIVLVHGLGGSHLNWDLLAPKLTARARVLAIDLPGFGMSEPTGRPATIRSNVAVLARFIREVCDRPVVLVGNSMGGLVSILLTARMPPLVHGLVLLDPALPAPTRVLRSPATAARLGLHALPGVGEWLRRARRRRIGARATVRETLRLCGIEQDALPAELIERSVALIERQSDVTGMDRAFLSASRSLAWVLVRTRAYRAAMSSISVPVLLVHGDRDQLVPVTAARGAARNHAAWRYVELAGVGHLPQLQVPDELARQILAWLGGLREPDPDAAAHPRTTRGRG